MRRLLSGLLLCVCVTIVSAQVGSLENIQALRLQGGLNAALQLANEQLADAAGAEAMALHLEMAKIEDRIGLHDNTRPVAAALQHIEAADVLAKDLDTHSQALVELAYAEYYYRAEMADRNFDKASRHADQALIMMAVLDDFHGQADAVHRLGLIELQKRNLDRAEELFETSLEFDRVDGERLLMRADYERHEGFVIYLRGEHAKAVPFFERSLDYRKRAGATDPAMFAAISLASTLVDVGREEEALPHLEYAIRVAEEIDSGAARSRIERIKLKMQSTPPK